MRTHAQVGATRKREKRTTCAWEGSKVSVEENGRVKSRTRIGRLWLEDRGT